MKKLLLKLSAITLLASPVAGLVVSCANSKSKSKQISGEVTFGQDSYGVEKGTTQTVQISNFSKINSKGFTQMSAKVSDEDIASVSLNAAANDGEAPSSLTISATGKGETTVTVDYVNINTQAIMEGTFTVKVLDFSKSKVTAEKSDEKDPINLYKAGSTITLGTIDNWNNFKSDYYDFTSGFNVAISDDNSKIKDEGDNSVSISKVLTNGRVNSNGQVIFDVAASLGDNESFKAGKVNISITKSGTFKCDPISAYIGEYAGGNAISVADPNTNSEVNIYKAGTISLADDSTSDRIKKISDGKYRFTYNLTTGSDSSMLSAEGDTDLTGYKNNSSIDFNSDVMSLVEGTLKCENNVLTFDVNIDTTNAFADTSFNLNLVFVKDDSGSSNANDSNDSKDSRYAGTYTQKITGYRKQISDVDGKTVEETNLCDNKDGYSLSKDTTKFSPGIDEKIKLNSSTINKITSNGYTFYKAVAIDDTSYSSISDTKNIDPTSNSQDISESITTLTKAINDNDSYKAAVSSSVSFDVNNITYSDSQLTVSTSGFIAQPNTSSAFHILISYKDNLGNIIVGQVKISVKPTSEKLGYNYFLDTSNLSNVNIIQDKSTNTSSTLNIHDGLTASTGFEMSSDNKTTKEDGNLILKVGEIAEDGTKTEYPKSITVKSSNTKLIKINASDYNKEDGSIGITLVGQGDKNVAAGSSEITITYTDDKGTEQSLKVTLYTSAFIGKESGDFNIYSILESDNLSANVTVSKNLKKTSFHLGGKETLKGSVEFEDGFSYDGSVGLFLASDSGNSDLHESVGKVVFDGNVTVKTAQMFATGYYGYFDDKILFNGDINYTANPDGLHSSLNGCGVICSNEMHLIGGYSDISVNGNVNITADSDSKFTNSNNYSLGFIDVGVDNVFGSINVAGNVTVDSSGWNKIGTVVGTAMILGSVSRQGNYPNVSKYDVNIGKETTQYSDESSSGNVTVLGSKAQQKGLIVDTAGYIQGTAGSQITVNGALTLGESDIATEKSDSNSSSSLTEDGEGNAIIIKNVQSHKPTSGSNILSYFGDITIGSYIVYNDDDKKTEYQNKGLFSYMGEYDSSLSGTTDKLGTIKIGNADAVALTTQLGDGDGYLTKIVTKYVEGTTNK